MLFHYTHFTSPIRRLNDLVVHNLMDYVLDKKIEQYPDEETLSKYAERASETERIAQKAEWDIVDMKILEHLKEKTGEESEGIVTNVKMDGFFVYVPDFFFEGFVERDTFPFKTKYLPEEKGMIIKKEKIEIGTRVLVMIDRVDIYAKKLFLRLKKILKN